MHAGLNRAGARGEKAPAVQRFDRKRRSAGPVRAASDFDTLIGVV
jgi:hypothetical protein